MEQNSKYTNIYFIGIGGIGMSAIARYYNFKGLKVAGYDRTPSEITRNLEKEGIEVHYEDRPELIPEDINSTLIVYTPAIPKEMKELKTAFQKGYRVIKRSRMLGEISEGQKCIGVAGTHGKTSTSTLITHILTDSKAGCSAFIGGISKNYGTNMLASDTPVVVVEADEFDRSFLQLHPSIAVITSMDADHLDIYGNLESIIDAFREFASQVSDNLIVKKGLENNFSVSNDSKIKISANIYTYSPDNIEADFYAINAKPDECGYFTYDLVCPSCLTDRINKGADVEIEDGNTIVRNIKLGIPGRVNMENSVAAAAACIIHGVNTDKIKAAMLSFKGVKRRMEIHYNTPNLTYIDDYAHHPKELAASISSLKEMFPKRKLTAIFQPHLFSRTKDFAKEFAEALSNADKLILLDIYPAREEPIPGVTSEIIFSKVTTPEKVLLKKEELLDYLKKELTDYRQDKQNVLTTFGAGNIDRLIEPITELCTELNGKSRNI